MFYSQSADEGKGFVKASELVEKAVPTSDDHEASTTPTDLGTPNSATKLATSFIPASKLMRASLVQNDLASSVRTEVNKHSWRNSSKIPPSSPVDKRASPSTSNLRRVHVDHNDLYEEASSDDDQLPGPPVSGSGMGFRRASLLSTSLALSHSGSTSTSVTACTSAVTSVPDRVTGHSRPLPNLFQNTM